MAKLKLTPEEEDVIYAKRGRELSSLQTQGGSPHADPAYLNPTTTTDSPLEPNARPDLINSQEDLSQLQEQAQQQGQSQSIENPAVVDNTTTDQEFLPPQQIEQSPDITQTDIIGNQLPSQDALTQNNVIQNQDNISSHIQKISGNDLNISANFNKKFENGVNIYEPKSKEVDFEKVGQQLEGETAKIRKAGKEEAKVSSQSAQEVADAELLGAQEKQRVINELSNPNSDVSMKRASDIVDLWDKFNEKFKPSLSKKILQFIGLAISNSAGPALLKEINRKAEAEAAQRMKFFKMQFPGAKELAMSDILRLASSSADLITKEYLARKNPKGALAAAKAKKIFEREAVKHRTSSIKTLSQSMALKRKNEIERGAPRTGKRIKVSSLLSKDDKQNVLYVPNHKDVGYLLGGKRQVASVKKDLMQYSAVNKLIHDYGRLMETSSVLTKAGARNTPGYSDLASSIEFVRGEIMLNYLKIKELGVLQKWDEVALERVMPIDFTKLFQSNAKQRFNDFEEHLHSMVKQYLGLSGLPDDKELYTPEYRPIKLSKFLSEIRKRRQASLGKNKK